MANDYTSARALHSSPAHNEGAQNSIEGTLPEKFINSLMLSGKKSVAVKIFSSAVDQFLGALNSPGVGAVRGVEQLQSAVGNVQPSLECRRCRVAGTSYQVPAVVSEKRATTLAVRWIIESARKKRKKSPQNFSQCLAQEFLDAHQKQGRPRQRRDQYHKLSSANRGYLRYRWW